jgi:RHS repeat-associated protein
MVRAESITATLRYTYTVDGLRVAQDVDGAVTTFAWDWATGVPEMLSDGSARYLVGHDTLGWEDAGGWTYAVPDALGSVSPWTGTGSQAVDATAAVVAARAWSPYGVESGGAQAGLGYTGEWWDVAVGLQYLRARWYDGRSGRFTQVDAVEINPPYLYGHANPINRVDPSGYIDWPTCVVQGNMAACTVWEGDSLYSIAREVSAAGVSGSLQQLVAEILAHNTQIQSRPNFHLYVGDTLMLPATWVMEMAPPATPVPPTPIRPLLPGSPLRSWDPAVDILRRWGGVNDLEAMAQISDAYAQLYPSWTSFLEEMSLTFLGVRTFGPGTLIKAALATRQDGCIGVGREPRDCSANEEGPYFLDTGFHIDYRDGHNQPYHVWGFIAETAFPLDLKHAATGGCIAHAGNIFHDIIQSHLFLNTDNSYGTSWQDYFLSLAGIEIGSGISSKLIVSPSELGRVLRDRLGPDGPGSRGAIHWWVEHWDIAPLDP